jgi:hypothetical protein
MVNRDVEFFVKIIVHPQVVIAHKKVDGDTAVPYFGEFTEYAYKALGHHVLVFKPEVKQITQQENSGGIFFNAIQPAHKDALPGEGSLKQWVRPNDCHWRNRFFCLEEYPFRSVNI